MTVRFVVYRYTVDLHAHNEIIWQLTKYTYEILLSTTILKKFVIFVIFRLEFYFTVPAKSIINKDDPRQYK